MADAIETLEVPEIDTEVGTDIEAGSMLICPLQSLDLPIKSDLDPCLIDTAAWEDMVNPTGYVERVERRTIWTRNTPRIRQVRHFETPSMNYGMLQATKSGDSYF